MKILQVFQEADGSWSWARVASSVTLGYSLWAFTHQVIITGHIPDPATIGGLTAFILGPYTVNKAATAFARPGSQL